MPPPEVGRPALVLRDERTSSRGIRDVLSDGGLLLGSTVLVFVVAEVFTAKTGGTNLLRVTGASEAARRSSRSSPRRGSSGLAAASPSSRRRTGSPTRSTTVSRAGRRTGARARCSRPRWARSRSRSCSTTTSSTTGSSLASAPSTTDPRAAPIARPRATPRGSAPRRAVDAWRRESGRLRVSRDTRADGAVPTSPNSEFGWLRRPPGMAVAAGLQPVRPSMGRGGCRASQLAHAARPASARVGAPRIRDPRLDRQRAPERNHCTSLRLRRTAVTVCSPVCRSPDASLHCPARSATSNNLDADTLYDILCAMTAATGRRHTRNLHVPLSDAAYVLLRAEAERSKQPATTLAREAIDRWLAERQRAAVHDAISEYAQAAAGTADDLDPPLEEAAVEHLLGAGRRARKARRK